jgi:ABC-type nitrate/sulfonate/bicarbonate transport system permease component
LRWEATVVLYKLPPIVLPSPWAVIATLGELVRTQAFWRDVLGECLRVHRWLRDRRRTRRRRRLLLGEWRVFRLAATPVVEALRFIVPFAWIPLTILWFGTSVTGKIVLVAYAVFFVMVVSTARAIALVDPTLSRVGTMLGMGPVAARVERSSARRRTDLASAARAAAAIGWIAVVAAEYIGRAPASAS